MDTNVKNLQEVFQAGQRLLVPLFQRPYVWNEEKQWTPLWEDIERLANRHDVEGDAVEPHFLGAVVLQKASGSTMVQTRTIIDGQQRLSTIQLLFHAAFTVLKEHGAVQAEHLRAHFRNSESYLVPSDRFKLTPTTRDQDAYWSLITIGEDPAPLSGPINQSSLLTKAHAFFQSRIRKWLEAGNVLQRAATLTSCLVFKLNLVVIELEPTEDSQQIFETLNARGTPLSGADLIKNFVFQKLELDKADTEAMYRKYWSMFETPFWEEEISVGRVSTPRISNFLAQWLIAQMGLEVPSREVFRRFKQFADHEAKKPMVALLPDIDGCAVTYQSWNQASWIRTGDLSPLELFAYRTSVLGTQSAGALLIWATDPSKEIVPPEQLRKFVSVLESWLVRRALMRSSNGGIGLFVAGLISQLNHSSRLYAGDILSRLLTESSSANLAWPTDDDIRAEISEMPVYSRFRKPFLRMILEAVEDHYRGYGTAHRSYAENRVHRGEHAIEHLLPQKWADHWNVGDDITRQMHRERHVHRLGNLTLVAGGLNSKVSNGPWQGPAGKIQALNKHSILLMNQKIVQLGSEGWHEDVIDARTEHIIEIILHIWPVSAEALGVSQADSIKNTDVGISVLDLIKAGHLSVDQELYARGMDVVAKVLGDGALHVDNERFETPSGAGRYLRKKATNGWKFWLVDRDRGVTLAQLRTKLLEAQGQS